jgi:signal recognition particle subunit SRP54
MLETISKGFRSVKHRFQGKRELTENIDEALRDIRVSLLEADVDFKVVRQFVAAVKEKAVGEVVRIEAKTGTGEKIKVNPGDHFIKICHEELQGLMGPVDTSLKFGAGVTKIMMVGPSGLRQDDHHRQARADARLRRVASPCSSRPTSTARPPWSS